MIWRQVVYLKKIRLQAIKCFEDVTLKFPHHDGNYAGWNVILGENGRGKSTILRSIALGALHPLLAFHALQQHEGPFIRREPGGQATVTADLIFHPPELRVSDEAVESYQRQLTFSSKEGDPDVSLTPGGRSGDKRELTLNQVQFFG
jgi:DNA repair exonuclease SbcCD ATPase subunit